MADLCQWMILQALTHARKAGADFEQVLTNGLAQGKTFSAICSNASLKVVELPAFSLSTRSLPKEWEGRVDLSLLKEAASSLSPGKTGPFELTRDGGLIVHLLSRQPVDEARLKAELPAFTASLRAERRREAVNEWLRKEFELAHLTGGPLQKKPGSR